MIEELSLSRIIFRPIEAYNEPMGGLDSLVMGYLLTPASKFGSMFNDVLRNHLFEAPNLDKEGLFNDDEKKKTKERSFVFFN